MTLLFLAAVVLLGLGAWLYVRSGQQRRAAGLPAGEIIYVDAGDWRRADRPLFSERYQLTGKPDYLIDQGREIIPVEVKSARLGQNQPYDSHKLQLAAYCLLIEESEGVRPAYGVIKYADAAIRLPYTAALRAELLHTLDLMRRDLAARHVPRSHDDPARCRHCGYAHACGEQ